MRKALQAMINTHFSKSTLGAPSKDVLDIIVESSNGDIRSAIMALQFACIAQASGSKKKKAKIANSLVLEAVTRREQSLALFHLLGKVMYNKSACPGPVLELGLSIHREKRPKQLIG
jgi:cell cycle checkpoint protein